jgi:hypothetical protein
MLLDEDFVVPANGRVEVGSVPQSLKQSMWLIDWSTSELPMRSHYLCGPRPFQLGDYRRWLANLAIPPDAGPEFH